MKIEIRHTHKNALLSRDEIDCDIFFEGHTPSRANVHKDISKKLGANPETIVVKNITSLFGEQKVKATIYHYTTKDALDKIEPAYLIKRHGGKGDAKAEAQAQIEE